MNSNITFIVPAGANIFLPNTSRLTVPLSTCPKHSKQIPRASIRKTEPNFKGLLLATITSAAISLYCASPACAVISAPQCYKGEGPGCEAAAAESPLIRELLEKSKANKEKTDKELLERYWKQGYGDYFSFGYNKVLKKDSDGKWSLQDPDDLQSRIEGYIRDKFLKK